MRESYLLELLHRKSTLFFYGFNTYNVDCSIGQSVVPILEFWCALSVIIIVI